MLRRMADELGVPLSSVLLAAHAKVLAALSGEREVATGYVGRRAARPLLCGLTTEAESWRSCCSPPIVRRRAAGVHGLSVG